jgi:hypothetical protein
VTDISQSPPTTRFGRLERRGLLLGLSGPQVAVLGMAGALLVLGMYARGGTGLLITAVLWVPLAVVATVSVGGRPLLSWLPVLAHWQARSLAGQTEYRAKPARARIVGQLGLPGDAARLRLVASPATGTALVHDPAAHTLTAVARVEAPTFDLADVDTQHARVDGWGRLLASLTPASGVARVQVLQRTVPETGVDLARFWATHGVRDGSWAAQIVADLVATAPSRARHEGFLAVSVDVPRASGLSKAAGGLERHMTAITTAAARADLRTERWLDKAALGWVLRTAYDPAAAAGTPEPGSSGGGLAGPVAVNEEYDRLRADGSSHAVYWITEWPRDQSPARFLESLIFAGATHALSIIATPQPTAKAVREIRKAKADHQADAGQRARLGQVADEALAGELDDVIAREKELAAGHTVLDFTGLLSVTATDAAQLDAACMEMEVAASQAGCEVRRLVGQQAQAFVAAALPLARSVS